MASSIFVNPSSTGGSSSTVALADGSAGAPSLSFLTAPTTGLFLSGGSPHISVGGADTYVFGAATLLTNTAITTNGSVTIPSGTFFLWSGLTLLTTAVDGELTMTNFAASAGIGLDFATDSVLKVRNRAQTSPAAINCGINAIAAVSTDGVLTANDTAATSGATVQMSPRHRWRSHVWNTTSSGSDNTDDWIVETLPTSGATPSSFFKIGNSLNGAGYTYPMTLSPAGNMTILGSYNAGGGVNMAQASHLQWGGTRADIASPADGQINFLTASQVTGIGIDVATDGVFKVRVRAQNAYAPLDALSYRVGGVSGVASFGPSVVTSITVVGGIITAIS